MAIIGKFTAKVYKTTDRKKLKTASKIYLYGTISIRDPKLNNYIGDDVVVKISTKEKSKNNK